MVSQYHDTMDRDRLVANFEAGTIDNSAFSHADPVFMIWSLIRSHGTLEAIRRFENSLKQIIVADGHSDKYNATITCALGFLIAERIAQDPSLDWDDFAYYNPDLLQWPNKLLANLYANGAMHTEQARRTFILPRVTIRP
jgi:hypothetical protein